MQQQTVDIDFQIEAYRWVYRQRGHRFMQRLWRRLEQAGLKEAIESVIRPNMPAEMEEVYRAAIDYMAELAPQLG